MNSIKKIVHFLGGIKFALILIGLVAICVMAGTFIESKTQSHLFASNAIYSNPVFIALLWGFFINILVSALRRWPFKIRHIPFLVTHLGLLMILAGCLVKSYFGVQGNLAVMEGSGSHQVILPNTYMISLLSQENKPSAYSLNKKIGFQTKFSITHPENSDVNIQVLEFSPHSENQFSTWVKGGLGVINGLSPFPAYNIADFSQPLPESTRVRFHHSNAIPWIIKAINTSDPNETLIKKLYLDNLKIIFKDRLTNQIVYEDLLENSLGKLNLKDHLIQIKFDIAELKDSKLVIDVTNGQYKEKIVIPLSDQKSLLNTIENRFLGLCPFSVDLQRSYPLIGLIQDKDKVTFLSMDLSGQVDSKIYSNDSLESAYAYDNGFGGYTVNYKLPFPSYYVSGTLKEDVRLNLFKNSIRDSLKTSNSLVPPLELIQNACRETNTEFSECLIDFLSFWDNHRGWLLPKDIILPPSLEKFLKKLNWQNEFKNDFKSAQWIVRLFDELNLDFLSPDEILQKLKEKKWPLVNEIEKIQVKNTQEILDVLTDQIFSIGDQLPEILPTFISPEENARLLTAYLRKYFIHLSDILENFTVTDESVKDYLLLQVDQLDIENKDKLLADLNAQEVVLETPLTRNVTAVLPNKKLEDNQPKITLKISDHENSELISLPFEPLGQGLKWPILNGKYLIKFQPQSLEIPYHIRLRTARQITYAHSSQPFSFESDLLIYENENEPVEKTISMNHVYETWDGFRFYLANIAPATENAVKRVQIIVNHDPGKYFLTYPGAIILSLGIILLFWMKPYKILRKNDSSNTKSIK